MLSIVRFLNTSKIILVLTFRSQAFVGAWPWWILISLAFHFPLTHWGSFETKKIQRMGGRVVEGTGLENRQGLIASRGFESHPIRHLSIDLMTSHVLIKGYLWKRFFLNQKIVISG